VELALAWRITSVLLRLFERGLIWMGRTALRLSWASPEDVRLFKNVGRVIHCR
jgi:hypothetical protein